MPQIVTEKRKRGPLGWIVVAVFWAWQALMLAWMVSGMSGSASVYGRATSEAGKSGAAAGMAVGFVLVLFVWALGSVVFGMMLMATRGKRILVTQV